MCCWNGQIETDEWEMCFLSYPAHGWEIQSLRSFYHCWKILFTVVWFAAASVCFHRYQHQGKCGCCDSCSPVKGALFSQLWCCLAGWCMKEFLKTVLFCTEIICVHNRHDPNFSLCSCFCQWVLLSSIWFYLIFFANQSWINTLQELSRIELMSYSNVLDGWALCSLCGVLKTSVKHQKAMLNHCLLPGAVSVRLESLSGGNENI